MLSGSIHTATKQKPQSLGILFKLLLLLWLLRSLPTFNMQLATFFTPSTQIADKNDSFAAKHRRDHPFLRDPNATGKQAVTTWSTASLKIKNHMTGHSSILRKGKYQSQLPEINRMEKICKLPCSEAGSYIFLWLLLCLQSHDPFRIMGCY